jgi:DNA-binding NtrC family response regulator
MLQPAGMQPTRLFGETTKANDMRDIDGGPLVAVSRVMRELQAEIERIALADAKVLVTGESGVGKEVVARQIHARGPRGSHPFQPINCAGIPETLLEAELFGHVRGSFSGAFRDKPGRLEIASGGTIFLDEVGEMSLRMQGLLLRFLETGELQKVGAERVSIVSNVRVIAATNRDLRDRIEHGHFREDLFYRLNVIQLNVPPLRNRREDIPTLIEHFLRRRARRVLKDSGDSILAASEISPEALAILADYAWPGNVRQLENVVERLVVNVRNERIEVADLPPEILAHSSVQLGQGKERRRTVADDLFKRLVTDGKPFWASVYPMYMNREITRNDMRALLHKGLEEARGNYTIVLRLFNMEPKDYKRFLNFLRKHDCRLPFKDYRKAS